MRRAGYRVLRQAGRTEPEGLLALILLAMLYLLGLGCMDSRNVPGDGADGNIGGAERQYSGCERTVCKRNIAGVKEDNYSNR